MLLDTGVTWHKNECLPTILIIAKPFIVSTKLSIISLFHKIFLRRLQEIPITVGMFIKGYP